MDCARQPANMSVLIKLQGILCLPSAMLFLVRFRFQDQTRPFVCSDMLWHFTSPGHACTQSYTRCVMRGTSQTAYPSLTAAAIPTGCVDPFGRWSRQFDTHKGKDATDVQEVWFAGSHCGTYRRASWVYWSQ